MIVSGLNWVSLYLNFFCCPIRLNCWKLSKETTKLEKRGGFRNTWWVKAGYEIIKNRKRVFRNRISKSL